VALLVLDQAPVEVLEVGVFFDLLERAVDEEAVDLFLQILAVARDVSLGGDGVPGSCAALHKLED
jgi:hypothetical protein